MNSSGHYCDGHFVSSSDSAPFCCHDVLTYRYVYFEHVLQIRAVCIRSLNWLTWYLLSVLPQGRRDTHFSHCGGAGLGGWGSCCCCYCYCVLLCNTDEKEPPGVVYMEKITLPFVIFACRLSLYNLVTECTENIASKIILLLLAYPLPRTSFIEPLPSKGCLFWLSCHDMY
jgi:hypothetical protein